MFTSPELFYPLVGLLSLFHIVFIVLVLKDINKPHIRSRSPWIIIVIFVGAWGDTVSKMAIRHLNKNFITEKCQLAVTTRLVFHMTALLFIFVRIYIVNRLSRINLEIREVITKRERLMACQQQIQSSEAIKNSLFNDKSYMTSLERKIKRHVAKLSKEIQTKSEEPKRLRESRFITMVFVNYLVPLFIFSLVALLSPVILRYVPIQERDACRVYFLVRAPI
jgi:hypothetical protein